MIADVTLTKNGYIVDGRTLPRVSTILGSLSKPGLDGWRKAVGVDEADRIVQVASELGSRIHAAIEQIHHGVVWQPAHGESDLVPYIDAYLQWFRAEVASVEMTEQVVYSLRLGYGGTLDVVYRMRDGRRILGDLKSSKSLNESMRLQLAAYALALEEMGHGAVDGRAIIHLPSNAPGVVRFVEFDRAEQDALTWRCLVQLYRWRQQHKDLWKESRA